MTPKTKKARGFIYDPAAKLVKADARIRKLERLLAEAVDLVERWDESMRPSSYEIAQGMADSGPEPLIAKIRKALKERP